MMCHLKEISLYGAVIRVQGSRHVRGKEATAPQWAGPAASARRDTGVAAGSNLHCHDYSHLWLGNCLGLVGALASLATPRLNDAWAHEAAHEAARAAVALRRDHSGFLPCRRSLADFSHLSVSTQFHKVRRVLPNNV